jgi:hypothetical protein
MREVVFLDTAVAQGVTAIRKSMMDQLPLHIRSQLAYGELLGHWLFAKLISTGRLSCHQPSLSWAQLS